MKNIFKTIALIFIVNVAYAQQIPLTSQYMFNNYLLNPAEAGSEDCLVATLSARSQWTGLEGAPKTQFFSMHTKFGEKMGVGGYVFNDETGPVSERGIQLSYAYHLNVSDKGKLSFGIAGMMFFHDINRASFRAEESGDDAINSLQTQAVSPDINFGMMYYTDKFKLGFSAPQLLQNNMYGTLADANNLNSLSRHYYLFGEYNFTLSDKFDIVFLDADKENYIEYYKSISNKLVKGGILISDNVLWSGKVLEATSNDLETDILKRFNRLLKNDKKFETIIIPIRDGVSISRLI